jgi:hypothetical protein
LSLTECLVCLLDWLFVCLVVFFASSFCARRFHGPEG